MTAVPVVPVAVTGTRTELEVAADTVAALFGAHMLEMTRGRVSEVSIATGVPVAALHQAWRRWDAGLHTRPSGRVCDDTSRRPSGKADPGRPRPNPKPQAIPDDATEWVCSKKDCDAKGEPQPIDCFEVRADTGTRRTICKECRRRYNRRRYLSVETSERLGTILRFIVATGDDCEGDACGRCHGPLLAAKRSKLTMSWSSTINGARRDRGRLPGRGAGLRHLRVPA